MIKQSLWKLLSLVFLISLMGITHAQKTEFEDFVTKTMLERNVAGVSIARIESGNIVEQFALSHQ